jgi:hypothetical protein
MLDGSSGVRFGPHGHRGSALHGTFTEAHVMAVVQAICDYRRHEGVSGPLFIIRDRQVLSEPAFITAVEVLAANGIATIVDQADRCTPTPLLSHAILTHNRGRTTHPADGIVISTASGASEDGGIGYQLPTGAPADAEAAGRINRRANRQLADRLRRVSRVPYERAGRAGTIHRHDFVDAYVDDLASLVDIDAIRRAGLRIGIDSTGTSAACWAQIADEHGIDIERLPHGAAAHRDPAARVDLAVVVNADACEYCVATRGAGAMPRRKRWRSFAITRVRGAPACSVIAACRGLLLFCRRIVLQHLRDGFGQILLLLLRLRFGVNRLAGDGSEDERFRRRRVHVERELADIDRRRGPRRHAAAAAVPAGPIPPRTIAPPGVERRVLLLLTDTGLVADKEVRCVAFGLG